jgi:hypothetical protein
MKKLFVTELLGPWQLERSCGDRREEITQFMHKYLKKASKNEAVDLSVELTKLTNNVTCRIIIFFF